MSRTGVQISKPNVVHISQRVNGRTRRYRLNAWSRYEPIHDYIVEASCAVRVHDQVPALAQCLARCSCFDIPSASLAAFDKQPVSESEANSCYFSLGLSVLTAVV